MNFDFNPDQQSIIIPKEAYKPVKRCPFCHSVYLTDTHCESCQRSLNFDLVGTPFSYKSAYQIKERYLAAVPLFNKFFPTFENKKNKEAKSLVRNLEKRLRDLCLGFSTPGLMKNEDRKVFYIEAKYVIEELVEYHVDFNFIEKIIVDSLEEQILLQDLTSFARETVLNKTNPPSASEVILAYKLFGVLRIEFILKFGITMAAVVYAAIKFQNL